MAQEQSGKKDTSERSVSELYPLQRRDISFIALSFAVVALAVVLPTPAGLTHEGQVMLGILAMAVILWITTPIPIAVTALLVMIMQPLLDVMPAVDVFHAFGNEAVFFLIGAFVLASAIERHGLHRRIALRFLRAFRQSPRMFTFGIMVSSALLSFIMPEHGVVALFLPIVTSILIAMRVVPGQSNFGRVSMLCIAYGCSIGSLGTPIGGARNPLTISVLANAGIKISFFEWMSYSTPVVFIALPIVWLILHFTFPLEVDDIADARKKIDDRVQEMGAMGRPEMTVAAILAVTIGLWMFASQELGLAVIALLGGALLFFTGTISWEDVEKRVPWGVVLLYGGAITLGMSLKETGAAQWIVDLIIGTGSEPYIILLALIVLTIAITNFISNTAAVAMLLPIGLAIASEIPDISPLLSSMTIALSGGLAFMLVIATPGNAITYSAGYFSTRDLLKGGTIANLVCIGVVFAVAILYWKGFLGL